MDIFFIPNIQGLIKVSALAGVIRLRGLFRSRYIKVRGILYSTICIFFLKSGIYAGYPLYRAKDMQLFYIQTVY